MELTSQLIQKYSKYTIPQLRKKAGIKFRSWIRKRDKDQSCISCGSRNDLQAGHYYSAGHYPGLEFNEDNVNIQCLQCNYHKHGNLLEYRKGLLKKIGTERLEQLDFFVSASYKTTYKHDRFRLIEIIDKYSK